MRLAETYRETRSPVFWPKNQINVGAIDDIALGERCGIDKSAWITGR